MLDFLKAAAAAPELKVADCEYNLARILETVETARRLGVQLLVLPELCVTGSTCGDLFAHSSLLSAAKDALLQLALKTAGVNMIVVAGVPIAHSGAVYNCAAVLKDGRVLGLVAKTCPPGPHDSRVFSAAPQEPELVVLEGAGVPLAQGMIFCGAPDESFALGVEIGGDRLISPAPSSLLCAAGATVIAAPFAAPESIFSSPESDEAWRSRAGLCGYISAGAGMGESSTDGVYSGRCGVYECGEALDCTAPFEGGMAVSELDLGRIAFERTRTPALAAPRARALPVHFEVAEASLTRRFDRAPFVPKARDGWRSVLDIQAAAFAKRLAHTGSKTAVLGVSGGLDSTLALVAAKKAFELIGRDGADITAVTMPCFGTSETTLKSARRLCAALDVPLREIDISESVRRHLADIGHSGGELDAAFENAQARERTQVLMDIANMRGGLVVGTGDMSELALGWATYNGDHMSMYGVNAGVPKTLVRHVLDRYAENCGNMALRQAIMAVLETPVSPELLPPKDGLMTQLTEDLVGPYALHDFFLFYMLGRGYGPEKLYVAAQSAFSGEYDGKTIYRWLEVFCRRFFSQQFKRSCMPDGPAVCGISLSPRGGLDMPSDASSGAWARELARLRAV